MNIVIFGAGAIGSLFGGLLSEKNNVILYGRQPHVDIIKNKGLRITGKTIFNKKLSATNNIKEIKPDIDLIIIAVKSYDTVKSLKTIKKIITDNTIIITIQNGLDNISKIQESFDQKNIIGGTTTQAALYLESGLIKHTGIGKTFLGEIDGKISKRLTKIVDLFNESGIKTNYSEDIIREIWIKTIINSCINPLTTIFQCKNGYLLENPILSNIIELISKESCTIASSHGLDIDYHDILNKTIEVINNTSDNYSSMLQSYNKNKKTEIKSINGKIIEIGKKQKKETIINEILFLLIKEKLINLNLINKY
jgi:2-dehydropantoate 2-reductase